MRIEQIPNQDPKPGFLPFETVAETEQRNKIATQYNLAPNQIYLKGGQWYHRDQVLRDKSHDGIPRDDDAQVWN